MSTLNDMLQLINGLAQDNARLSQEGKRLLEENRALKIKLAKREGKPDGKPSPVAGDDPPRGG